MGEFLEYMAVALASTIKFVGGPIAGVGLGMNLIETTLSSAMGMMFTVLIITYGSSFLAKLRTVFFKKSKEPRKVFNKTTRLAIKVKQKLGLWGVAFLTPFLFTPILGTFIAISFRYPKTQIVQRMLVCAIVAGFIQTVAFHYINKLF